MRIQCFHMFHAYGARKFAHLGESFRPANEEDRLGVGKKVPQFTRRVGYVQGQVDRTRPQGCQIEEDRCRRLVHLNGHAVAWPHSKIRQDICQLSRPDEKIAVAQRGSVRAFDECGGAIGRKARGE